MQSLAIWLYACFFVCLFFVEIYNIVDVAFNPEVLHRAEKNSQEKEQIHLLALNFIQKQHKLHLSQHYTVMKAKLKGILQDMKHRLMSLHRPLSQDNSQFQFKPGKRQILTSLKDRGEKIITCFWM